MLPNAFHHRMREHLQRRSRLAKRIVLLVSIFAFALIPAQQSFAINTFNPTLLVNTQPYQVIDDMSAQDLSLKFGSTLNKTLTYERTFERFKFNAGVYVQGSFGVTGTMSGNALYVQRAFSGAGLTSCSNGTNDKLLWNSGTQQFSCGADQTGAGGGLTQAGGDARYVNQSGDTMTGALRVNVTGGNINTLGLQVNNTASGAHMHAEQTLTSSGQLVVEGNLTFGDALADAITVHAGTWTFANDTNFVLDGGANGLSFDTTTLSIDASANRVGIGTTAPDTTLEVIGTASGRIVRAQDTLASSGSLSVEGTTSFRDIQYTWPSNETAGSGLVLSLSGSSTNQLSWTGPFIKRINGSSGVAGPYMTLQNLTSNSADCTTTALCASVMTTTGLGVGTWKFKYTLNYQTAATTTGIGIAINHTGTATTPGILWWHLTSGGAAATGIGDDVAGTAAGQLIEGKNGRTLNATIGSLTVGVVTANANTAAIVEGVVVVTASGNLELKIASEIASSAVRIMDDSTLELLKMQ